MPDKFEPLTGVVYEIGDSCNAYNSLQGVFYVARGDSRPKILLLF